MKTKVVTLFLIAVCFISLAASADQDSQTLIQLDQEVDSLILRRAVIEFNEDLESNTSTSRSQAGKSKHFLFSNHYCQIFNETDSKIIFSKIPKGSSYEISSMYIIDNIILPSESSITEIYFKMENYRNEVGLVEIFCRFPSELIDGSSDINKFFEIGLNNIATYSVALFL